MTQQGTIKTEFERAYSYLNPDPLKGPSVWRLTNLPPTGSGGGDETIHEIVTLLPVDKTETGTTVNLFFNIVGLPTSRSVSSLQNYIKSILGTFKAELPKLPKRTTYNLKGLRGVDPIKTEVADNVGIVYFDIRDLPTLDTVKRHRLYNISPSTFKYNSKSVDVLTADIPLESVTANGTATVSLDFRNLPEA